MYVFQFQSGKVEDWHAEIVIPGETSDHLITPQKNKIFSLFELKDNLDGKKYSNGFRRISHQVYGNEYIVVQYLGDSKLYEAAPHGNKDETSYKMCSISANWS